MSEPRQIFPKASEKDNPLLIGRYMLHREIARGGMATIHVARLVGDEGFNRIVAAKRLHPEFAEDPEFVAMFLDEARIASKVQHPNVVPVLDVVTAGDEVILVQEYVQGAPLHWLLRAMRQEGVHMPVNVAVAIACHVLAGLHATHECVDELGHPMHIVHRDVSPQNVMMTLDGSARLLDFGVAKAVMAAHVTREGTYKGKLAYSAPEQLRGQATRQSDVYSLSVLLWELLVGERMHRTRSGAELVSAVMNGQVPSICEALTLAQAWTHIGLVERRQLELLNPIVSKGLAIDMRDRWACAADMEEALAQAVRPATARVVADWVKVVGREFLDRRDGLIAAEEASFRRQQPASQARTVSALAERQSQVHARVPDAELAASGPLFSHMYRRPASGMSRALLACAAAFVMTLLGLLVVRAFSGRTEAPVAGAEGTPARNEQVGASRAGAAPALRAEPQQPTRSALAPSPVASQPPEAKTESADAASTAARDARAAQHPVRRPVVESKVDRRVRTPSARPTFEPEGSPEPPAAPAAVKQTSDCDVPYYFEGSKKIFKPACI